MNFLKRRRLKKQIKHLLHDAKHARHMREDIVDEALLELVHEAEDDLRNAWTSGANENQLDEAAELLVERTRAIYPIKSNPRVREYVEILVVAISVAMAFRTFFVQPFKIPTGSMEPTLNGIKAEAQAERGWADRFPLSIVSMVLFGDRYVEVRAARSGRIENLMRDETYIFSPNGVVPPFRPGMTQHFEPGQYVERGQLLASGRVRSGDHIFVNKVRYNFARPKRGDVFVFGTDGIDHPDVKVDTFYIKRLVGLPGESIQLAPPYLLVNGERLVDPPIFQRLVNDTRAGYRGFIFPPMSPRMPPAALGHRQSVLTLGDGHYLPLGDNTAHSLDGRYFGGVHESNIVGPAFMVYWPISSRWGWIR